MTLTCEDCTVQCFRTSLGATVGQLDSNMQAHFGSSSTGADTAALWELA